MLIRNPPLAPTHTLQVLSLAQPAPEATYSTGTWPRLGGNEWSNDKRSNTNSHSKANALTRSEEERGGTQTSVATPLGLERTISGLLGVVCVFRYARSQKQS